MRNKQAHLKRLKDDIAAKMEDTHALNRECDKATVSFAEQEHQLQEVSSRLLTSSAQAEGAREAKQRALEQVQGAEQALEAAVQGALDSEQRLATRIQASKEAISAFFALKKEANAKEWELSKAKTTLEQRIGRQQELLAGLESGNLVTSVKLAAEATEASPSVCMICMYA
jgi:predicted  nucleic acid-binding Zn-ribbon protein